MPQARSINAGQFIKDVRRRMSRDALRKKYDLTQAQCQRAIQKAVDLNLLSDADASSFRSTGAGEIDLVQLAQDIRGLLIKHRISAVRLAELLPKLLLSNDVAKAHDLTVRAVKKKKKHKINALEFAQDVQLGMDQSNLMTKYRLSPDQLETVIQRLISADLLTEAEVYDRTVPFDTQILEAEAAAQSAIDELGGGEPVTNVVVQGGDLTTRRRR